MATEKLQIYKCEICGNLVQVIEPSFGELVCCNQPMKLQSVQHDKTEIGEKHAPVIEIKENEKYVTVKSHPMVKEHYIQFIEVYKKDKSEMHLKYFNPDDTAELDINCMPEDVEATEFCNIHGLWGENKND